jgi:hypothetical protein
MMRNICIAWLNVNMIRQMNRKLASARKRCFFTADTGDVDVKSVLVIKMVENLRLQASAIFNCDKRILCWKNAFTYQTVICQNQSSIIHVLMSIRCIYLILINVIK